MELANGSSVDYDILAIGTGTVPILPGIPGQDLEGVFTLKRLNDAIRIKAYIEEKAGPQRRHNRRRVHQYGDVREPAPPKH